MGRGKTAFMESFETMPSDLDKWLVDNWDFDPSKPYTRQKDKDGWWWFFQADGEEQV